MIRTNKDILIGLIKTLSDNDCREILYFITDKEYKEDNLLHFNLVTLTKDQYSKLIWLWGKDKTDKCINILNDWLENKKIKKKLSCYRQLVGWVERKYYQENDVWDKSITHASNIDSKWKAKRYIKRIPPELRAWDSQVKYLVNKYGVDILNG